MLWEPASLGKQTESTSQNELCRALNAIRNDCNTGI